MRVCRQIQAEIGVEVGRITHSGKVNKLLFKTVGQPWAFLKALGFFEVN